MHFRYNSPTQCIPEHKTRRQFETHQTQCVGARQVRWPSRTYPEEFLNRFLKDFLTDFWDDRNDDGNAEAYLGGFTLNDRATAERLAAWMLDRFEKLELGPEVKFEIEVIESPRGKFRVVAASFYRGQICQISGED